LLHAYWVRRAAFDRRLVRADHTLDAVNNPDAVDAARAGRFVVVHAPRRERAQFEERCARIEQALDALARQQLARLKVLFHGAFAAAGTHLRLTVGKLTDKRAVMFEVAAVFLATRVDLRTNDSG